MTFDETNIFLFIINYLHGMKKGYVTTIMPSIQSS